MASQELKKLWKQICNDLTVAQELVPEEAHVNDRYCDYIEYLEHNELELACDMLEEVGRAYVLTKPEFWRALRDACVKMKLYEKAAYYADIARGDLTINDRYWNA